MARLIEFFTKSGELVLDPFAGVGGTLLGRRDRARTAAGHRHRARPALGRRCTARPSTALGAERDGAGPAARRPRPATTRAASRGFDPSGLELRRRRRPRAAAGRSRTRRIDFVATDPPYNVQLPMTMAGGKLAEAHANRRTDYAMVTDLAARPRQPARLPGVPRRDGRRSSPSATACSGPGATPSSSSATPTRAAATCSPPRTWRRAPTRVGLVPKGDIAWYQAGTRLRPYGYPRLVRAEHRAPAHRRAAQGAGAGAGPGRSRRPARRRRTRPRRTGAAPPCRRGGCPRSRRPAARRRRRSRCRRPA